jgi:hypothetical protein
MASEFGFVTLDAGLLVEEVQARIRRHVQSRLEDRKIRTLTENLRSLRPLLFEEDSTGRNAPPEPGGAGAAGTGSSGS